MGSSEVETQGMHLPERWAVLEQALAEMKADDEPASDESDTENDSDTEGGVQRNRDAEDTRSRNQPVRPASGNPTSGEQHPRGGMR